MSERSMQCSLKILVHGECGEIFRPPQEEFKSTGKTLALDDD